MSLFISSRGAKPSFGSLASKVLHTVEPEEHFEPFKPEPELGDGVNSFSNTASVDESRRSVSSSPFQIVKTSFPTRSSSLFSPLSPPCATETTGKENEAAGDKEGNSHSDSPITSIDTGAAVGFKLSPPLLGGSRGSLVKRPSLANRLSFIDSNWLERCQVFGELEAEEIPGGGNQEIPDKKLQEKDILEEKAERDLKAEKNQSVDFTEEKLANPVGDNTTNCAQEDAEEGKRVKAGEIDREQSSLLPDDDSEDRQKSESTKKRMRKRQREGDDMVEGVKEGAKKRRRNNKNKEESETLSSNSTDGGEGKKKKTKGKDPSEGDEEEATKAAKTVRCKMIHTLPQQTLH